MIGPEGIVPMPSQSTYTQDTRVGELFTPLGKDVLLLTRFDGSEGVSELFEYRIEAMQPNWEQTREFLNFDEAIGKHCSVSIVTATGDKRWFDGILTEVQCLGTGNRGMMYRLVLRPMLWVLAQRYNMLIFADKTAPDIIGTILKDGGVEFKPSLTKSYPTLEYCVQYRESDMDFVCRLMEQNGISYHFLHSQGKHEMILGDSETAWKTIDGTTRPFNPITNVAQFGEEHFISWMPERRFTTGKVTLNDYNFKTPSTSLLAEMSGDAKYENGKKEDYDYPGGHTVKSDGDKYARTRIDMERSADELYVASGDCVTCFPGALVTLKRHPAKDQNVEHLALRCTHTYVGANNYASGSSMGDSNVYQGSYEFRRTRGGKNFAPPIVTPKPVVYGPQTAKVVGPDGARVGKSAGTPDDGTAIHCDEYGRIRVRFYWDRGDEKSISMWCRVSQVWAGKNWGAMFIPRVGMEVIVEFLEGDPDRPIIVGCVYNADNMPPYALPGDKNIAGIKSRSTEKGEVANYNEFVFIDTKGSEVIRTWAEKDLETTVEHDETRAILNDRNTEITNNEGHKTGVNRTTEIGKIDKLTVGDKLEISAENEVVITVGSSMIKMTKNKIEIQSPTVEITATQTLKTAATMRSVHSAGAEYSIQGTMVKINS